MTIQNIQVNFFAKSHNFFDISERGVVFLGVRLGHEEHLIILGPTLLKIAILLDESIDDV